MGTSDIFVKMELSAKISSLDTYKLCAKRLKLEISPVMLTKRRKNPIKINSCFKQKIRDLSVTCCTPCVPIPCTPCTLHNTMFALSVRKLAPEPFRRHR